MQFFKRKGLMSLYVKRIGEQVTRKFIMTKFIVLDMHIPVVKVIKLLT